MIKLPNSIVKAVETAPKDLIIYSQPKMGKTSMVADLTKRLEGRGLIINLEKNGTDYLDGYYVNCYENHETGFREAYINFLEIIKLIKEEPNKYDFIIIDSLTVLDQWSEIGGTYKYMKSVTGKNFNKGPNGEVINHESSNFRLVTSLADGAGFKWTREWFLEQFELLSSLAPYRIWIAHIKDKFIKQDGGADIVSGTEINLTGKLKSILAVNVTSLAKLVPEGNQRFLSFDIDNDNLVAGSRAPSLKGRILISELKTDEETGEEYLTTFWEKIYPELLLKKESPQKNKK